MTFLSSCSVPAGLSARGMSVLSTCPVSLSTGGVSVLSTCPVSLSTGGVPVLSTCPVSLSTGGVSVLSTCPVSVFRWYVCFVVLPNVSVSVYLYPSFLFLTLTSSAA